MSERLMFWLLANYAAIGGFALYEGNYPRALYWAGAMTITVAVLWMTK